MMVGTYDPSGEGEGHPPLLAALVTVAQLRQQRDEIQAGITQRRKKLEAVLQPALGTLREIEADLLSAEARAREVALAEYQRTRMKALEGGVKIRLRTNLVFQDCEAEVWCETNMPVAFERVWNRKPFLEYARRYDLPFVTREEVPEATLPRVISLIEEAEYAEEGEGQ